MSRQEVRHVVAAVIINGPTHRQQFREAWEMLCLMAGSVGGAIGLICIALRWIWRVVRLLALPITLPILTWHYRHVRIRSIKKARAARDDWKRTRAEMRARIHKFGDELSATPPAGEPR
ncbi:hypothetical protein [Cupriavidus sp. BIC8F]|uniref:hypothetical protein n=1 Tax=Cupriavidus sp. BIC8F TaxID=3079014 RepID=UPI002916FB17|nr:hypothetical protein [Cupriavidus sp. BIC8F]